MTPEKQRIAIAEWCGWHHGSVQPSKWFPDGGTGWIGPNGLGCLPDYLNDLNAIHEAEEKLLTGDGWKDRLAKYSSKLMSVMHETEFGRIDVAFKNDMVHLRYFTLHATAAQRAEALLRTIGKWTDQQKAPTEAGA